MVGLEPSGFPAIPATTRMKLDERQPFRRREAPERCDPPRSVVSRPRSSNFRVCAVVFGALREALVPMTLVIRARLGRVLFWVRLAPATHRLASAVGIALYPLAAVPLPFLRVLERHVHLTTRTDNAPVAS